MAGPSDSRGFSSVVSCADTSDRTTRDATWIVAREDDSADSIEGRIAAGWHGLRGVGESADAYRGTRSQLLALRAPMIGASFQGAEAGRPPYPLALYLSWRHP